MTKTVDEGFRVFHSRLTPNSGETEAAKNHRASIESCLKTNFEITRFFRSGSFGNGTNISGYSDVDYFASIPTKNLKQDSSYTLRQVRDTLNTRFPNTGVHVDTPAIVVPFGNDGSETTEVIPADFIKKTEQDYLVYEIADGNGGWMRTSPDAHNAYVANVHSEHNNKVKPLVRFLKAWKYYRDVPISSFYLEMWIARYALGEESILYSIDIERIFYFLANSNLAAMQDPTGISGFIYPCATEAKKTDALSKLNTALTRAQKARESEVAGKTAEAFTWWDLVFAGKFPAYE